MTTLKELKKQRSAVLSISNIVSASKRISAAKLNFFKKKIDNARSFYLSVLRLLFSVNFSLKKEGKKVAVVFFSNQGFCGSFNLLMFKFLNLSQFDYVFYVGKKGKILLRNIKNSFFIDVSENDFSGMSTLLNEILLKNPLSLVFYYYDVKKMLKNEVYSENLLNLNEQFKRLDKESLKIEENTIIDKNNLFRLFVLAKINLCFIENKIAEYQKRLLTMQGAYKNAEKLLTDLKLQYNKKRQEIITREITEIVSATCEN